MACRSAATLAGGGTVTLPSNQERVLLEGAERAPGRRSASPRAARSTTATVTTIDTSVAGNAEVWVTERYTQGWKGGAGREATIRKIVARIDGYLTAHQLTLATLTRPTT